MPVLFLKHQNMKKIYNLLYKRFIPKLKAELIAKPTQGGVFHQNGYLYATDGHIGVRVPAVYPDDLEGLLIDKKGEKIGKNFPNLERILPDVSSTHGVELDLERIEKAVRNVQRVNIKHRYDTNYAAIEVEEGSYFQAHYIASIFDLFKALKEEFQFRIKDVGSYTQQQLLAVSENYLFDDVYEVVLMSNV